MIPRDELLRVLRVKQAMVHDLRERQDLAPIVVHHRRGLHVATVHACGDREESGTALPMLSIRLGAAGFDTDEMIVTAEVHRRWVVDGLALAAVETPRRGELARAYAADPVSDVEPAIASTYVRRGSDEASVLLVPYRYTDHGGVLAVEAGEIDGPMPGSGPLSEAMVRAVNLADADPARQLWRAVSIEADATADTVAQLIVAMFDHGVMVAP